MNKKYIQYICWNYTTVRQTTYDNWPKLHTELHLIRLKDGRGLLRTTKEMHQLGLME